MTENDLFQIIARERSRKDSRRYRVFSHLDDVFVVLRAHGIIDLDQPSLIGAAIGECIRHDDPAISPMGRCFSIP